MRVASSRIGRASGRMLALSKSKCTARRTIFSFVGGGGGGGACATGGGGGGAFLKKEEGLQGRPQDLQGVLAVVRRYAWAKGFHTRSKPNPWKSFTLVVANSVMPC